MVVVCAQMEADLAGLSDEEAQEFLASYGLEESSLDRTIKLAYHTLGLASFLTAGPKEVRAWTFRRGEQSLSGRIRLLCTEGGFLESRRIWTRRWP